MHAKQRETCKPIIFLFTFPGKQDVYFVQRLFQMGLLTSEFYFSLYSFLFISNHICDFISEQLFLLQLALDSYIQLGDICLLDRIFTSRFHHVAFIQPFAEKRSVAHFDQIALHSHVSFFRSFSQMSFYSAFSAFWHLGSSLVSLVPVRLCVKRAKCGVIIHHGSMRFACLLTSLAWFPSI